MLATPQVEDRFYKILFFAVLAVYALLFSPFQFDDTDGGYIMGFSWRIFNGEIPYKDFVMSKPPMSAYIHSISMFLLPAFMQYAFEKILMYIFIGFYSYLFVVSISRFFNISEYGLNKWLLVTVCFLFSAHNFPAMPWQTTDGITLATLGLYFILKKDTISNCFAGILFLFLAASTKQSFYPMPLAGLILITVLYRNTKLTLLAAFFLILFVSAFVFFLVVNSALDGFLYWTTGITKFSDLIDSGFVNYLEAQSIKQPLLIIGVFALIAMAYRFVFKKKVKSILFLYVFITMLLGISVYKCFSSYCIFCTQFYYPQLLFIISVLYCVIKFFKSPGEKSPIVLLAFLSLSWCVSISLGYKTPILFFSPVLFIFLLIAKELFEAETSFYKYVLYLSMASFFLLNAFSFYPGQFGKKHEMTKHLGNLFPKLSFNYTGNDTYEKYAELKNIIAEFGTNFKVLPGMPMVSFITNTHPPLVADWMIDNDFSFQVDFFVKDFLDKKPYVIFEKKSMFAFPSNISKEIIKHCELVSDRKYFVIYKFKTTE